MVKHIVIIISCCCCVLGFMQGSLAARQQETALTLKVHQSTLGKVLDEITRVTGKKIILDGNWKNYPVSVELNNAPLHTALRRILSGLSSALVYLQEDTIKIVIMQNVPADKTSLSFSSSTAEGIESQNQTAEAVKLPELPGQLFDADTLFATAEGKKPFEAPEIRDVESED